MMADETTDDQSEQPERTQERVGARIIAQAGKQVDMPPIRQVNRTFKQAPKAKPAAAADALPLWAVEEG